MVQANLDLFVLQDKKFIFDIYTRESAVYIVVSMGAPIRHCGGVAVFYRTPLQFSVKALHQFVPNIVRLQLVTREQQ